MTSNFGGVSWDMFIPFQTSQPGLSCFSNDVLTCFSLPFLIQESMSAATAWALFPVLSVARILVFLLVDDIAVMLLARSGASANTTSEAIKKPSGDTCISLLAICSTSLTMSLAVAKMLPGAQHAACCCLRRYSASRSSRTPTSLDGTLEPMVLL